MRLYHDRQDQRTGGLDVRDEEDCYTAIGRIIGVFVSTEPVTGSSAYVGDVDPDVIADYEVSGADDEARSYVIPGAVIAGLDFTGTP